MGVLVITNRLHEASALGKHSERGEACTKTDPSGDGDRLASATDLSRSKALGDVVPLTVMSIADTQRRYLRNHKATHDDGV